MTWRTAAIAPLVVLVVAIVCFFPFLIETREVVEATPQPPPLFEARAIELDVGGQACTRPLRVDANTDVARIRAGRYANSPATRLLVSVRGPGYAVRREFEDYADLAALDLPLPDPSRPVETELCVENRGPLLGLVAGSAEPRTRGKLLTTVDGEPLDVGLVVTLLRSRPASLIDRLDAVSVHAAALQPRFAPRGVLIALALLVAVGLPAGVALALRVSRRSGPP